MCSNMGLPVDPGVSNNSFLPSHPINFNPHVCPSMPMLQTNTTPQFLHPNHRNIPRNLQHVVHNTSSQVHAPFIPDMQVIKNVPPPSFKVPGPPTLPGNFPPAWESSQMINNNHFIDQSSQFPARLPFPPPMFSSNSHNGINGQQNSISQTNDFQRNQVAPFTNMSSNSVQPVSNSFDYATNGYPNNGFSAFTNDRNPSNFNRDNRSAKCFGGNSMQSASNQGYCTPAFGYTSNIPYNGNGQKAPFMIESNGNKFHHNRGVKRRHGSGGSYTNDKLPNSYSTDQGTIYKSVNANNAFGGPAQKFDRNSDVPKPYSCDTCDRAFSSEAELMHHLSEHIKCNSGDCQFEAHPKIVALHKKMQHDTGYADAISKLKNADEIEKWRAERRRRFPTSENIEKRKAEQAEKEARGEVIENKEFGKFKGRNSQQNGSQNNDRMNARKRRRGAQKMRNAVSASQYPYSFAKRIANDYLTESDSDDDSHIKLPKFLGMGALDVPENLESHIDEPPNSNELSDKMPRKRTVNPMPMGNSDVETVDPMEKNTSVAEQSMERDSATDGPIELYVDKYASENQADDEPHKKRRKVSNTVLDIDELPLEIPITKEKDDMPPSKVFNLVSDADIDDEPPMEIPIAKRVSSRNESVDKEDDEPLKKRGKVVDIDELPLELPITKGKDSADDSPVELCAEKSPSENQSIRNETKNGYHNSRARGWRDFNGNKEYPEPPRKSSLLEKLLADDIRHERNVIMQCVRHIVNKNFFDINVKN